MLSFILKLVVVVTTLTYVYGGVTPYMTFESVDVNNKCGLKPNETWTIAAQVVLPETDKIIFRSKIKVQAVSDVCTVDLNSCSESPRENSYCFCQKQAGDVYSVHIGARASKELSGKEIQAVIPGKDSFGRLTVSTMIGKIPNVVEKLSMVNLTYQVDSGPVKFIQSGQSLPVCPNTSTILKLCATDKKPESVLRIADSEQVLTAISECVEWSKNYDFGDKSVHSLTVTYQDSTDCSDTDVYKIDIKEQLEGCHGRTACETVPTTGESTTAPTTETTVTTIKSTASTPPTTETAATTIKSTASTPQTTETEVTTIKFTASTPPTTETAATTIKSTAPTPPTTETAATTIKSTASSPTTTETTSLVDNFCAKSTVLQNGLRPFCSKDLNGDVWATIQKRVSKTTDFYQNWQRYETGFGDSSTNFWLGLQHIYQMCNVGTPCRLRIDMVYKGKPQTVTKTSDGHYYAEYSEFYLTGPHDDYRLKISGYKGTAGDGGYGLSYHNNARFSTKDMDNDEWDRDHCAQLIHSGGWFSGNCNYYYWAANLNGVMRSPGSQDYSAVTSANWYPLTGWNSLERIEIQVTNV